MVREVPFDKEDKPNVLLSIIIVNYNGKHHLQGCLDSVKEHTDALLTEVILVDNNSQDGSVEYLENEYPWVKLMKSSENLGFTGGNNLGAQFAKGKYLLLLNNDTEVVSSLHPMLDLMQNKQGLGALGCRLHYGDGRLQESIGYEHTPISMSLSWSGISKLVKWGSFAQRTVHHTSPIYSLGYVECDWVSGACLLTPVSVWNELSGLDDEYFMYVEDVDYCKRLRLQGYTVGYTSDVKVVHYEGGGRIWIGQRALLNTVRSYKLYTRKFFGTSGVLVLAFLLSPTLLVRSALFYLLFIFSKEDFLKDKSVSYFKAVIKLLSNVEGRV